VLWSGSFVAHRTVLHDHVFVAPHAVICGYCEVGEYSFVGANATLKDGVKIAPDCVVGAGALVVKDTDAQKVYAGSPARALPGRSCLDVRL
jgi:carbonic anhydrase/acetyltransferase-like protein (isoleucine patch superfamily)